MDENWKGWGDSAIIHDWTTLLRELTSYVKCKEPLTVQSDEYFWIWNDKTEWSKGSGTEIFLFFNILPLVSYTVKHNCFYVQNCHQTFPDVVV